MYYKERKRALLFLFYGYDAFVKVVEHLLFFQKMLFFRNLGSFYIHVILIYARLN